MKRLIGFVLILCLAFTMVPSAVFAEDTPVDNSHLITYKMPGPYDYYIDGDPMQITDEEFFGVWDYAMQRWSSQPYFRYDDFPDMIRVKEAAQAGQYDVAKNELLEYYRSVKDQRSVPFSTTPSAKLHLVSKALQKNVYSVNFLAGTIEDFVTVDNEWKEYSINATKSFASSVIGTQSVRGFTIMSVDKHLTQAEIYARESEHPPVLELVVNGLPMVIEASKDAMIRGGKYSSTNYGTEEIITVQESGEYKNFNENTKRAVIAFDISKLKSSDKVTSATIKFWARNASQTGEKELMIYRLNNASFDENEVVMDEYTDCVLWSCNDQNTWSYITPPAPNKGKAMSFHRGMEFNAVAQLYSYTQDEVHAYTYIRQLMGMVNSIGYDDYILSALDMSRHLDYGPRNLYWVMTSKHMTGEYLTAILKTWWQKANYEQGYFYGKAKNNWGSYATLGVYSFISKFPEFEVYDEWYERTQKENNRLISLFTFSDGMSIELPLGYNATILDTISGPFTVYEETGVPVPYSDYALNTVVHDLVANFILCSSPGFKGYNLSDGNDYNSSYVGDIEKFYYLLFPDDPMFEYAVTGGLSGEMPENPTTNFPVGLRTFMRSSWDKDALAMSFTNAIYGSHDHNDMLSITMFANGRFLLVDPAYGSLKSSKVDGGFMLSAPQHNLVTINNHDHDTRMVAYQEEFESNKLYDFVEYGGQYSSDMVNQKRNVLFLKNQKFWIVGDYENPEDQTVTNSYEQNWHMLPLAYPTYNEETKEIRSNFEDYNVNVVPVGIEGMSIYNEDTYFSHVSGSLEENIKTVLQKYATGDTTFNTIILPRGLNEDFDVQCELIAVEGVPQTMVNAFTAKIKNLLTGKENYYYYYHLNNADMRTKVDLGRFSTDAVTMLVETDMEGKITSTFLMGATILEDDNLPEKILFKSETPIESIAYQENGQIFDVESSTLTEKMMDGVTMYADGQFNVRLCGELIDGKKAGNYLYFADEPIIGDTEGDGEQPDGEQPEEIKPAEKPNKEHGSSGGGGGSSSGGGSVKPPVVTPPVIQPPVVTPPVVTDPVTPPVEDKPELPSNVEKELSGHWGKEQIADLYTKGVITGDDKGLRLKESISRAEFTALVVRALGIEVAEYKGTFDDVTENFWGAGYIEAAYDMGLINGADGKFRPNDTITREEICKIIASAIKSDEATSELEFTDSDKISPWAVESVKTAYSLGIVNGMGNGEFSPKSNALREQAFVMLARMLSK